MVDLIHNSPDWEFNNLLIIGAGGISLIEFLKVENELPAVTGDKEDASRRYIVRIGLAAVLFH